MVVCIESVASTIKPLRKEFFNKFNNVFFKFFMVIIQIFFTLESVLVIFQKVAYFDNIFKFITGPIKGLKFHISDCISILCLKLIFSLITFVIEFMLYVLNILAIPTLHKHAKTKISTTEITNFGFTYELFLF